MRKKLALLAAMAMCVSSVPMTFAPYAAPVSAAESAFNETNYFVVVGTYHSRDGENYTQLRYVHGNSTDKVAWKNAPESLTYGDVLVAEEDVELTKVYEHLDEPIYANAYVNYLNDAAALKLVGHCTELMDRKELTVTSRMYDGSGHWSIRLTDENGEEYYHGLSVVGSSLDVNLAYDAEVGDKILFAFDSRKIRIPLEIIKPNVPSWVPQSFEEAMEFYNEYGVTHISKGNNISDVVCLVFPESDSSAKYEIKARGMVNEIYHKTFTSSIGDTKYEVVAYYDDCKSPTSFSVDLNCNDEIQWSYVFDCDGSGNLTETDLYSWVPDCITEFNEFEEENGVLSVKNGYVAFCETSIPGAGYSWTYNQSGDGELAKIINVRCTEHEEVYAVGGAVKNFCLLKPEKDGKVNLNLVLERSFQQDSAMETIDKTFLISENCTKIKEVSNSLNLPELKQGEARVIITDYDTGELIPEEVFSSMEYFMMGTNIGYKNPNVDGGWMYTGPMYDIDSNPYYCDLAKFMNADLFEVRLASTVDGYYSPDDRPIITKNDNGSLEIEFRLKKEKNNLPELKQGEARVIITDYETGELIPDEVISSMEYFMMGTNIGYKNPNVDGGWMYTGPMYDIDSNPYYCDLAKFMNADLFEVNLTSAPEGYSLPDDYKVITKNDNGSLEIEFRLKKEKNNLPELKQGEARVILTDYETGEIIPQDVFDTFEGLCLTLNIGDKDENGEWHYTDCAYAIDSNPFYCDAAKDMNRDYFNVDINTPEGYYIPNYGTVLTKNDNGSLEIEFRLKKTPEIIKTGKVEGCSESNLTYTLDSEGTLTISGEGEIPCHVGLSDDSIKKIVIEDGVTGIGMESFFCKNLETIRLPENGCYIDSYAFSGGEKLKEIYIPDTEAGGISGTAFGMRDSSFTVIGYDDTYAQLYAEMAGFTFKSLGKPERKILFSDSLGGDVKYDFYNTLEAVISGKGKMNDYNYQTTPFSYSAVKSVTVEEGVTNIPEGFFNKCSILTQITLPESLTSIGSAAFFECTALTEITIPKNVTSIGVEVFRGAENFKTIKGYKGSYAETYAKENGFEFVALNDEELLYGDANCDGDVSLADSVIILQSIASPDVYGVNGTHETHITAQGSLNADVYQRGSGLTPQDSLEIQKYLIKLINSFE